MIVTGRYLNNFKNLYEHYENVVNTFLKSHLGETDPRTSQWLFTRSPIPLFITLALYYIIALYGPRVMQNKKPYDVRKILMLYNISQICLSSFIMKELIVSSYQGGFSLTCQTLDVSMNPIALRLASCSWYYHISKYVDLLDTVFFVVRKKGQQMSFLHLFHHSTMLFNSYLGILYIPGGQAIVSTFLNSFVHVVMYWYYLLCAAGPKFKKYLWWKKYLTILQLTQFFTVLAHVFLGSYSGCEVPYWLKIYVISYVSALIILFVNFYLSSYEKMTLLKALGSVCFQNQFKKSPHDISYESENKKYSEIKHENYKEFPEEINLNNLVKRSGGNKARSPFTIVSKKIVSESLGETNADFSPENNKDM